MHSVLTLRGNVSLLQGAQGDKGVQGEVGDKGYPGAQGEPGFPGEVGRAGPQGGQGESGDDGAEVGMVLSWQYIKLAFHQFLIATT